MSSLKPKVESGMFLLGTKSTTECQVFIMYGDYKMSGSNNEKIWSQLLTCLENQRKSHSQIFIGTQWTKFKTLT